MGFAAETTGRLRLHKLARDGRAAVTDDTWRVRMMVRAPGAVGEEDLSLSDVSAVTDLSADGRTVVFAELGDIELESGTYLRAASGGQALRLGPRLPRAPSPDGRRVVAQLFGTPVRLVTNETRAGEPQQVTLGPIEEVTFAVVR